eukprot:snap_masked-scaffold_11-processed-gene-12.50-mRNA-1 protein AED:1.00 eAED:1.00 QI:0/0/0/0/1/1/2/0/60
MSFKAESIKDQFQQRNQGNHLVIQWSFSGDTPIERKRFNEESSIFLEELPITEEIQTLEY